MKKFILFLFVCIMMTASVAMAYNPYPTHLNDDNNFVLCDGHMGTAWYVDRSSLVIEKYEPPQYIISVNVVTVNEADQGNTNISLVRTFRFFYNYDLRKMFVDRDDQSNWRYLDPWGCWADTGGSMPAGEIAFYSAYKQKFYGVLNKYSQYTKKYYHPFDDSLYSRI